MGEQVCERARLDAGWQRPRLAARGGMGEDRRTAADAGDALLALIVVTRTGPA